MCGGVVAVAIIQAARIFPKQDDARGRYGNRYATFRAASPDYRAEDLQTPSMDDARGQLDRSADALSGAGARRGLPLQRPLTGSSAAGVFRIVR